ncbi:hypothetical protein ASE57_11100 [Sphingomonas sp. Leaf11]|nr:hypothetical protein ASE58_11095 [Sphingomonas sp. Leaf9]KQM42698.1 hypothetical protein ASE57_11100 [Sphingomonas sp. Leaf11]
MALKVYIALKWLWPPDNHAAMITTFEQARAALAFLEQHRLEPSIEFYDFALVYLYQSDPILSEDVDRAIDEDGALTTARAADIAAALRERRSGPADAAVLAVRVATTERELVGLRDQIAALRALVLSQIGPGDDAEHDRLTHTLNQTGAQRILEQIGQQDRRFVVLMFSIDRLVAINRDFGHSVGDNILNSFAGKLKRTFPNEQAIRWGGNEFIVVVPGQTATAVRELAEEALTLLEQRNFRLRDTGASIGKVTASAAVVSDHVGDIDAILREARAKIDMAIAAGGNRVEV